VIYIFENRRICQRLLLNFNPTIVPLIVSPQATFNSRYIYRVTDNIAEKLFAPLKSLTNQNANLNLANFDQNLPSLGEFSGRTNLVNDHRK